jgi:hypothetical protein
MDSQMWLYANRRSQYAKIARKVELCSAHTWKPCLGDGCDVDGACKRHSRTVEVVHRYLRAIGR